MLKLSCYGVCVGLLIGCSSGSGDQPPPAYVPVPCERELPARTAFIAMPDTQFYACAYDAIFEAQTRFIADNVESMGLGVVVHTGDVVYTNKETH